MGYSFHTVIGGACKTSAYTTRTDLFVPVDAMPVTGGEWEVDHALCLCHSVESS